MKLLRGVRVLRAAAPRPGRARSRPFPAAAGAEAAEGCPGPRGFGTGGAPSAENRGASNAVPAACASPQAAADGPSLPRCPEVGFHGGKPRISTGL